MVACIVAGALSVQPSIVDQSAKGEAFAYV